MGWTNETDIFGLPLFTDDDKPSWRGDFNYAMAQLDNNAGPRGAALAPDASAPAPPTGHVISHFQDGDAWTDAIGGWGARTDIVRNGSQSWGFDETDNTAKSHTTRLELTPPLDVRGKSVVVDAYISDPTKVTDFILTLDSGITGNSNNMQSQPMSVRVVDGGRWVEWVFPYGTAFDQLGSPDRSTMRRIGMRINTNGPISVRLNGIRLVDQTDMAPGYPNGAIILESDDGAGSNVLFHQVLSEYGIPGTINMIAENADRPDRLSIAQLRAWQDEGWEIQGHAYALTTQNYLNLSLVDADKDMGRLKSWLKENGFNGQFIVYPQGGYNDTLAKIASKYFRGARTVYPTPVTGRGIRPYAMAAWSIDNTTTIASVTNGMDLGVKTGAPVHLVFHHFEVGGDTVASDPKGWTTGRLRAIIEHGLSKGYSFITYSDVYGDKPKPNPTPVVHRDWVASDSNFMAWPCDPSMVTTAHDLVDQMQYVSRVKVSKPGNITKAQFQVTAGTDITGGTVDVWDESGKRLDSAPIITHLGVSGVATVPLSILNRRAGEILYVGIRGMFTGVAPKIRGVSGTPNLGLSGATARYATAGTTTASLATITPSTLTTTGIGGAYPWVGLA